VILKAMCKHREVLLIIRAGSYSDAKDGPSISSSWLLTAESNGRGANTHVHEGVEAVLLGAGGLTLVQ
jgi:hypothetical protein